MVFTWSFDRSFSYNADYESRATFTVEPYVLPGMFFSCLNCQLQTATAHIPHAVLGYREHAFFLCDLDRFINSYVKRFKVTESMHSSYATYIA